MTCQTHEFIEQNVRETLQHWTPHLQAMAWDHGDPAQAWEHIITTCLAHQQNDQLTITDFCAILSAAGEALTEHIREQKPWAKAEWEEYAERSLIHHDLISNRETATLRNHPDRELPHRTHAHQSGRADSPPHHQHPPAGQRSRQHAELTGPVRRPLRDRQHLSSTPYTRKTLRR